MNKLIIKEIKPTKKHLCQSNSGCKELASDLLKMTGEKNIYLCEKHLIQFYTGIAKSFLDQTEEGE